jgi:tetratricopeptide (TPR) repeat protein
MIVRSLTLVGAVTLAMAAGFVAPEPSSAQIRMRNSEAQLLRESAARESRGDFDGAEEVLRQLLEADPASSGGLFALERVLRAQGTVVTILPVVDAFLVEQPHSSGVRSLKLRVLAEADSLHALREEADAWLDVESENEVPYREVARVYERAFGAEDALELLYDGRARIGEYDALALEVGDILAASGDIDGAADEWALAVGSDAAQVATVTRRVRGLTTGVEQAGLRVVAALAESPDVGRRRAGARIALDLGHEEEALALAKVVSGDLDGRGRTTFLSDVARRARENDLVEVAAWAYDELGEGASTPAERRQFDQRIIDVSLAAGDTVAALEAQRRVAESFSPGSVDRRRSTAQVIRLEGTRSDPEVLQSLLASFREEFPNAPELDDLAATVAGALQSRGDTAGAAALLEGIDGPKSSLERAYLLLAEGDVQEGRSALMLALTGLPPAEATPVIQFAGLLGRASTEGAQALSEAGVAAHRGRPGEAATGLAEAVETLEDGERAPILAEAARIAAAGGEARIAADIRRMIVQDYPDSPEVGDASLALARFHARTPRGIEEAIRLLEDLISQRPNAAVVPDARVELERLRGRG